MNSTAGIIGSGAWGTALAQSIALTEKAVQLWCYEEKVFKSINKSRKNPYLSTPLAENIHATKSLESVAKNNQTLFLAMPVQYYTEILPQINEYITDKHQLIVCSKGFRPSDGALLTDVIEENLTCNPEIGVLTGPAFALELAAGKPCMLSISSKSEVLIDNVNNILSYEKLRIYSNNDIIGSQIGAALKNIIAIAAGIAEALDLGESVRASIVCRGIKEVERYALACGGKSETIYGLAGLGDSILTSSSKVSRNYDFGYCIGSGMSTQEALNKVNGYVEGINTARIVTAKALSHGVDLAIFTAIDGIIQGDVSAEKVVDYLMKRPRTHELD